MDCKQAQQQIIDLPELEVTTVALKEHATQCAQCRLLLEQRTALQAALAQLRTDTVRTGPSANTTETIFKALQSRKVNHSTIGWRWAAAGTLVTAVLLLAALLSVSHRAHSSPSPVTIMAAADAPFTAMPYVIPPAPYERTAVVRTQVSLQVMLAAGFQVHSDDLDSTTLADVIYGEDGRILALRLVPQQNNASTKRMD